jgi:hypothetical protein
MLQNLGLCPALRAFEQGGIFIVLDPRRVQQKRALAIVRMRSLLNYSEHCRSEASARKQSRVLALLNRPPLYHGTSAFPVSSEGPPHSVASYDKQGDAEDLF